MSSLVLHARGDVVGGGNAVVVAISAARETVDLAFPKRLGRYVHHISVNRPLLRSVNATPQLCASGSRWRTPGPGWTAGRASSADNNECLGTR